MTKLGLLLVPVLLLACEDRKPPVFFVDASMRTVQGECWLQRVRKDGLVTATKGHVVDIAGGWRCEDGHDCKMIERACALTHTDGCEDLLARCAVMGTTP
jgi:hypothetical protein